jgi:hypothetical protein
MPNEKFNLPFDRDQKKAEPISYDWISDLNDKKLQNEINEARNKFSLHSVSSDVEDARYFRDLLEKLIEEQSKRKKAGQN